MSLQPRVVSLVTTLLLAALLAAAGVSAQAEERCSGTLCDFYYGGSAANEGQPAKPAAPTPIMVPKGGISSFFSSGSAPNTAPSDASGTPRSGSTSRVQLGGGGLMGMARGDTQERCTGTLCDLYHGGSPPEKPEAPAADAATQAAVEPDAAPANDEAEEAPRASRHRAGVEYVEREQKPLCAPTPQDPWRCYRK